MTLLRQRAADMLTVFDRKRILVVGDLMLDRYILGVVSRISPEAPVPVVHVREEKAVPGGASNVALNIRALGASATVGGIIGQDASGEVLSSLLREQGVDTGSILATNRIPTTVKTRVLAERQQVVRVDWEELYEYNESELDRFKSLLDEQIQVVDGIIIEDYGKGVIHQAMISHLIQRASQAGVPVGLDPKDNHELEIGGLTLATPNRREAFVAAGIAEGRPKENPLEDLRLLQVGDRLLELWNPGFLLITLGAQGMLLMRKGEAPVHVPTRAREVFDVSGAGDTVIATCLLAVAGGASFLEAAELANYAAGIVVAKLGTATCTPDELLAVIP
ncbi:MAG: D-glycero-beta-D-manno-heptose-7-phosphate kinase [Verrucomicrobia bacterium]|nr:D-glycero-beta-D-manno-heptose-7-phosphate kinase [Kiritimatiellia bacterium]MCP5487805.1 D-glycero-beta-D-manno-heptose-7-phosphate kinase [Verrucomicrobiota bacterium]